MTRSLMTRNLLALAATVFISSLGANNAFAAPAQLTIYSGDFDAVLQSSAQPGGPGFALYQTEFYGNFSSTQPQLSLSQLPQALDASSVQLRPLGNAKVLDQRFDFATANEEELLQRAIGQQVDVEQTVGNTSVNYRGELLAAGSGLSLRLADGRIKRLANYSSFELASLPDGMVTTPTLSWLVSGTGKQQFDLSYATAGLAWRAEYRAELSGQGKQCRMNFSGAAMVANRSGADFTNVALTLVAGEPQRTAVAGPEMMAMAAPMAKGMMADAPQQRESGDYHAYDLAGLRTLAQGSLQRLPLFDDADAIACERLYQTGGGEVWMPPHPMIDKNFNQYEGEQAVSSLLHFENRKSAGLGKPIPAGRMRVFDGKDFLGENNLGHTAENRRVEVTLGTAFDLSAERTRLDFQLNLDGREMQEKIQVVLRNAKSTAVSIDAIERMARWSDWEIISSSQASKKLDASSAEFAVTIPAGGETTLTYTVRYRWPTDVNLP